MSEKDPKKKSLRLRLRVPGGAVAYRELSIVTLIAALIIGAAFLITYRFVRPAPPGSFVISTGNEAGAYHMYGERYRELLAKERIRVEVRPSVGSIENLQRLADPESGVDVALVQGGVATPEQAEGLVSLAALYYEPLWIFYRDDNPLTLLGQLSGKRIAVGPEGSGTRVLVTHVLEAGRALKRGMPLSPLTGRDAADALIAGRLDAALFVAAPDAPVVQHLLKTPGIRLMSLSHAEALARKFHYLSAVTLPRGMIDLGADIPSSNVRMVASTTHLVARENFHPALVAVLLQAATKIHGGPGVFHRGGEFPAIRDGDFAVSEDAQRYFQSGPPFLQRYMPFWVANLIERLLVLLLPLIAVLIPVLRLMPVVYDWKVKRKVFRWYRELKTVELELRNNPDAADTAALLKRLDEIEDGVDHTEVPLTYWDYIYALRGHIEMVRAKLLRDPAKPAALPPPPQ
ncbi:MAG: TAXI family TRAP transporter solute-binding subunit [Burkholderiales bacterium]|nr:TAXI family TRAP transporter solute-binding subunit [Burkholderiales bacterium]MDP2398303.1 TAXI family TRAP transporter solute-binding subunit [Burkholderiales bacterium]